MKADPLPQNFVEGLKLEIKEEIAQEFFNSRRGSKAGAFSNKIGSTDSNVNESVDEIEPMSAAKESSMQGLIE